MNVGCNANDLLCLTMALGRSRICVFDRSKSQVTVRALEIPPFFYLALDTC